MMETTEEKRMEKVLDQVEYIVDKVSLEERFALLAEEVAEMCDAAENYRYSIQQKRKGKGRWKESNRELQKEMAEEIADVLAVILCCVDPTNMEIVIEIAENDLKQMRVRTKGDLKMYLGWLVNTGQIMRNVAFKYRRTIVKDNPTRWTEEYAVDMFSLGLPLFMAEMAAVIPDEQEKALEKMIFAKIERWYNRLIDLQGSDENGEG